MSDGRIRCARCDAVVRGSLCTTCGAAVESAGAVSAATYEAPTDAPATGPTAPVVQPALASPPPTGPPLAAPVPAAPPSERSQLVPILIAACVAVAIVTAGVVAAVSLSGGGDETADPSATTATVSTTTIITTTTSTTAPAPPAPTPVQPPTVFVPVPVPAAPVGGGSSASQSGSGSGADITAELVGPWVAVAASIPKSEGGSRSRAESVANSTFMPGYLVVVLDSDQFPGFNGGYWAVSGISMYSRSEAYDACLSSGLGVTGDGAGGECYPANVVNGDR